MADNEIIRGMSRWFNIGGPCNQADNYMLSVMARLPEAVCFLANRASGGAI